MPLFEVVGTTPRKTVFPIAFALASSESQEAFTWLTRQLRDLLLEDIGLQLTGNDRQVHVIVTDDDVGMKAAVSEAFPEVQQEICIWHIQKNVLKNLAEKWVTLPSTSGPSASHANANEDLPPSASVRIADLARPSMQRVELRASMAVEHSYLGLLDIWTSVCWATDIPTMRQRWTSLCEEFADQPGK